MSFDPQSGALGETRADAAAAAPFYFTLSADRRFLYACVTADSTTGQSAVAAYAVDAAAGTLRHINTVVVDGIETCHLSLDRAGWHLLHASYVSATAGVTALREDGGLGAHTAQHRIVTSGSVVASRQGEAHTHSIITDPADRYALVADLGSDCIWLFDYDPAAGQLGASPRRVDMRPGDGPRHMVFDPAGERLFVVNELSNSVASFAWRDGTLTPLRRASTLPVDYEGPNYAAEILCHPAGHRLYVSNRTHDSVVTYDIAGGRLEPLDTVSSHGQWPRGMALDPAARWLAVANHRSGTAALFAIDPATGLPVPHRTDIVLPEGFGIAFAG